MVTETWKCRLRNLDGRRDEHAHSYLELYAIDIIANKQNDRSRSIAIARG